MKTRFIAIVVFVLVAGAASAQIPLVSHITTNGPAQYPTHIDSLGYGGFRVVKDITERDAITTLRRKYGMAVYVQSNDSLYILKDLALGNNNWSAFGGSSGGGGGGTGSLSDYLKHADTATMLSKYMLSYFGLKYNDTATLLSGYARTGNTVQLSDTAAMLMYYAKKDSVLKPGDTAFLSSRIDNLSNDVNDKLNKNDTASLSNRINDINTLANTKLNAADTASLSNRIDARLKYTDTVTLSNRIDALSNQANDKLNKADTASLSNRIDNVANDKLNKTDTITLSNRIDALGNQSGNKLNASDTASLSNRIDNVNALANDKLNKADTASLSNRIDNVANDKLNKTDTITLSNRIDALGNQSGNKLNASDTASLSNRIDARLKYTDTVTLSNRIDALSNQANDKLNKTDTMTLSNRIDALGNQSGNKLNLSDTAAMLMYYAKKDSVFQAADTASLSNRIDNLANDKLSKTDTITLSNRIDALSGQSGNKLNASDTVSLSNRIDNATTLANNKLNAYDTASLSTRIENVSNLANGKLGATDTISLSGRIDQSVKYSDSTTTFVTPQQLRDTANAIRSDFPTGGGGSNGVDTFTTNPTLYLPAGFTLGKYANGSVAQWRGLTAREALLEAIVTAIAPTYNAPSVSLNSSPATTVEIGSQISVSLNATFNQNDGGSATGTVFKRGSTTISSPDIVTITSATAYSAQISYNQGPVKNNNLGTPHPAGQISAGTATSNTITYTPGYKRYYGWINDTTGITSAGFNDALITALGNEMSASRAKTWNTGSPSGSQFYVFVYVSTGGALSGASFNGIPSIGALNSVTRQFTNAQGYATNYYIYYTKQSQSTSSDIVTN